MNEQIVLLDEYLKNLITSDKPEYSVDEAGNLVNVTLSECDARVLYLTQPPLMDHETKNGKAGYYAIVTRMTEASESLDGRSAEQVGWYLAALVDVLDHMSMEIYEHYRALQDLLRQLVKKVLVSDMLDGQGETDDKTVSALFGYVILKACELKCLNPEKYEHIGRSLAFVVK